MNEKLKRMMGASVDGMLKQANGQNGALSESEFEVFWGMMKDPKEGAENATLFLFETIKWLIEVLKEIAAKDKKNANPPSVMTPELILVDGAVNAMNYIRYFVPYTDNGGRITRSLRAIQSADTDFALTERFPSVKEFLKSLSNAQGKTEVDSIHSLVLQASQLHSTEGFKTLGDVVGYPTLHENYRFSDELSFVFIMQHLSNLCKADEHNRVVILDSIVNNSLALPQQMKIGPAVAECTLLALLFMFRHFLAMAPITDRDFLKRVYPRIQQFYLWPCPFGNVAKEILQLLHNEIMSPGFTMRQRILREAMCGEFRDQAANGLTNRAIWYICDSADHAALSYARGMGLTVRRDEDKAKRGSYVERDNAKAASLSLPPITEAMVLLNAMFHDLRAGQPEAVMLSLVTTTQLHSIYQKFEEMNGHLYDMHMPDSAADWRAKALNAIRGELHRQAAAAQSGQAKGDRVPMPTTLTPPFLPALPELSHVSTECNISFISNFKEELRLMCLEYIPYPSTPVFDELESLLSSYASAPKPCEVRLCVSGGDKVLLAFLCSFLRVVQDNPEWLVGVRVKIGLLPWAKNGVAAFLARHDSWYKRHLYTPFRAPLFFLPWINIGQDPPLGVFKSDETMTGPGLFYRNLVNSYMRDANQVCNFTVWDVSAWLEPAKASEAVANLTEKDKLFEALPDHKIPFMQRLEIVGEGRGENPPTPDLDVNYTRMGLTGDEGRSVSDESGQYTYILLASVPRNGDQCFPPNPMSVWLELFVVQKDKGQNAGKKEARQHVSSITISCVEANKTFSIICDGQKFGPYHHVKISRTTWINPNDKEAGPVPFSLPIQTFFPVHL